MTGPDTIDYTQRAGARPMPDGWAPYHSTVFEHTRELWDDFVAGHTELHGLGAQQLTFCADISEYQAVVNSRYPYPVLIFRADTGFRLDNHASSNRRYVEAHQDHVRVAPIYSVFIPGQSDAIFQRLKNEFGSQCPPPFCPMTDMESGRGFAGPGNHSSEANDFVARLAAWSGRGGVEAGQSRQLGYANTPDWAGNWPSRHPWMKRTLANYGSTSGVPSGYYARQYYGALPYGVPHGYPTSCAPFGSYVDMNVIPRDIDTIVNDFGLDWFSMATKADLQAVVRAEIAANNAALAAAVWSTKLHNSAMNGGKGETASAGEFVTYADYFAQVAANHEKPAGAEFHVVAEDNTAD